MKLHLRKLDSMNRNGFPRDIYLNNPAGMFVRIEQRCPDLKEAVDLRNRLYKVINDYILENKGIKEKEEKETNEWKLERKIAETTKKLEGLRTTGTSDADCVNKEIPCNGEIQGLESSVQESSVSPGVPDTDSPATTDE